VPRLGALARHRAVWPLVVLAIILMLDAFFAPGFFRIRIVEGRLFGSLIDIVYRATPIAIVAIGMAVVIGTKGIDLSVGAVIAIVSAGIAWRIHEGDPPFGIPLLALPTRPPVGPWHGLPGAPPARPPDVATRRP